ncbi:MAG: hypothetical protein Q8873_06325 [Bacillota bacterium]|nr:hypothetical protein [Bacillota bacterium]
MKTELKKLFEKKEVLIIIAIAVAVMVFAGANREIKKSPAQGTAEETKIEKKLEDVLSTVKGAGKVKVMIVFRDDGKDNFAKDKKYSTGTDGKSQSEETTVMGSGKEAVIVDKDIPQVQGVIVTAEGAGDETVRDELKEAVEAILPVYSHKIEVLPQE